MNLLLPKVFVVAHPKFHERYTYIKKHLADRNVAEPVYVGVVGKDVLAAGSASQHAPELSAGQIGCALSHINAYKKMIEMGIEKAVIIEDDAILPQNFNDIVSLAATYLREGEIISLHSPTMQPQPLSKHGVIEICGNKFFHPMKATAVRSTLCYLIHCDTAKRILLANCGAHYLADNFGKFWEKGLVKHLRIASPQVVRVAGFESVIGYHTSPISKAVGWVLNSAPIVAAHRKRRREKMRLRRDMHHHLTDEISEAETGNPNYE